MIQAMKREYLLEKLIGLTKVCFIIASFIIVIIDPAQASPVSKAPFMKADIDQVAEGSLCTGAVPFVIDDTIPEVRAPWLPAGSELLILEVPLSEPSGYNRETDSTGALLIYDE